MLSIKKAGAAAALAALLAGGCGSSAGSSTGSASSTSSAGALSADAHSAATGDIPDNQVFLVFTNGGAGYSTKYPEGWTQSGTDSDITFRNKNNVVHIVVTRGATPTIASVTADLRALRRTTPALNFKAPHELAVGSGRAIASTYTTRSAPDPVTGRRVTLIVDRYALAHAGRVAIVDLGTPVGVDNVDAYKLMINSFRWR
jgi:hypothetical protein